MYASSTEQAPLICVLAWSYTLANRVCEILFQDWLGAYKPGVSCFGGGLWLWAEPNQRARIAVDALHQNA
jgi:hypothetical protein